MSTERIPVAAALATAALAASAALAGALPEVGAGAAPPSVRSLIVGNGGSLLSAARTVSASATTVRVGGRNCAVAAGTPLAVLAAVRRAGGPGFALRDYGHCGPSPRDSAQLFVYSVGGQRNSGQSGWEYKVDDVSGTAGAGDPSGPRGDGRRLHTGERVLWFWCRAVGAGCQRSLAVSASPSDVPAGGSVTVTVTGFDNEGRAAPVAGAIVTLGSDFASTAPSGRAALIAPSMPGRFAVAAARNGLVTSFPETIVVR
jgi:hypothetical protein